MSLFERLKPIVPIVGDNKAPTSAFMNLWQRVMTAIEASINGLAANVAAVVAAQADADAAQLNVDALETPTYICVSNTALLAGERSLTGNTGVTFTDGGAGSTYRINVSVTTILGYTPANKAGDTFSGPVDVQAALRCDDLRVDQAASASSATVTHSVPVNFNGTTYYVLLSTTP